ncbi:MAG: histidinol-phosphate transaminase [Actinobacteria bacterium]|nr:histidinol-phosphate transaminase [Actinomycetota bacterium]
MTWSPPVREELRGASPYGAPQLDVAVRLNTNENPFPPSPELAARIGQAAAAAALELNRYPDREAWSLREDLAAYLLRESAVAVDPAMVWPANGSNEVMQHVFSAFGGPGRLAMAFSPTYSMYEQYARDTLTRYRTVGRRPDFGLDAAMVVAAMIGGSPDIVVLTSPNNPTGTALTLDVVSAACAMSTGIVVVDEAYAEFRRPGTATALTLLEAHPNLVVTRTMSKAFALAGARVGYAVASPEVIDSLRLVRLPYHLSSITQAVARAALESSDELLGQVDLLRSERDDLVAWLRAAGFQAVDSDANFILMGEFADRHRAWQELLDRGVLVREVGPDGWLRVTVGTPQDNIALRAALGEVVGMDGMMVPPAEGDGSTDGGTA